MWCWCHKNGTFPSLRIDRNEKFISDKAKKRLHRNCEILLAVFAVDIRSFED